MTYRQIINIYPALSDLRKLQLPYAKARDVYRLCKFFENEYNFFIEEESKLIIKYNGSVGADSFITFADNDSKVLYANDINKLKDIDSDIAFQPIVLTSNDIGAQTITPETIDRLDGVVTFE